MCLNCNALTGENKRCSICKEQAISIKSAKNHKYEISFAGRQRFLNPQQIQSILSNISLQDAEKVLGIGVVPSEFIVNHVFIAPPIIRPDKRV
jgi:hypothetical protein